MKRYESLSEKCRRAEHERSTAERLATLQPFPASGSAWEAVKAQCPDISEPSLMLLLSLIIDFWWGNEVECIKEDDGAPSVYVQLGKKYRVRCGAEMHRVHPAHYVISVHDRDYLVVDKDFTERGGEYYCEREFVEVGTHPEATFGERFYDRDLRESTAYCSIFHLPVHDLCWRPPPRGADIIGDEAIRSAWEDGPEAARAYRARVEAVERQEIEMRARLVLGRAWKLQYLLRLWCGISLDEDLWKKTMDQILAIPISKPGNGRIQDLSWIEATEKFEDHSSIYKDDSIVDKLQMMVMLQLADRKCRHLTGALVDPLNPKGGAFIAALQVLTSSLWITLFAPPMSIGVERTG